MELKIKPLASCVNKIEDFKINGAKNSLLPLLFASVLVNDQITLHNAPTDLYDYIGSKKILEHVGLNITESFKDQAIYIAKGKLANFNIPQVISSKTRVSLLLLGALTKSAGQMKLGLPGGCSLGNGRPFDIHLDGLKALNADVYHEDNYIYIKHKKDIDATYRLRFPSVGATMNLILYAAVGSASVTLSNCAREPEVDDLVNFLNQCGAKINFNDANNQINIKGVSSLKGTSFAINFDRIQTITYACLALMHKKDIVLTGIDKPDIMAAPLNILEQAGVNFFYDKNSKSLTFLGSNLDKISGMNIIAKPYPYFPTDLQPIFTSLALTAKSKSTIIDTLYPERTAYLHEMKKVGAQVFCKNNKIHISPSSNLHGATMKSPDLRGGMACIMAASTTVGSSIIKNVEQIYRGYDNLLNKLQHFMHVEDIETNKCLLPAMDISA